MTTLTSYERFAVDSPILSESVVRQLESLKGFLGSAPTHWDFSQPMQRYMLPNGDQISCIFWNNLFFMTGTDIVRSLVYRLEAYGRPVKNFKKFEEGIFSDLRNLKPGIDAILEEPRSEFLEMLYRNNCIRTQKKQKVFFWFSVPHDRLFIDAIERDFKRETLGTETSTNEQTKKEATEQIRTHPLAHTGIPQRMVRFLIGDLASYSAPGGSVAPPRPVFNDLEFNPSGSFDSLPAMNEPLYYFDGPIISTPLLDYSPNSTISSMDPRRDAEMNYFLPQNEVCLPPMSILENMSQTYPITSKPEHAPRQRSHTAPAFWESPTPYARPSRDDVNSKAYMCPIENCGRAFKRSDQLRRHQKTHQHPYPCHIQGCPRSFVRQDQLMQHMALNHSSEPQYDHHFMNQDIDKTSYPTNLDRVDNSFSHPHLYFPALPPQFPFDHDVLNNHSFDSNYSLDSYYYNIPIKSSKLDIHDSLTGVHVQEPESILYPPTSEPALNSLPL